MGRADERQLTAAVARLQLLHPKARVNLPGSPDPIEVLGVLGKVLRLLALSAGHCFSSDVLADVLQYTTTKSVAPMIMQLRRRLGGPAWGDRAIRSEHGAGYMLDPSMVNLDAFEFRRIVEPVLSRYMTASEPEDLARDSAEEDLLQLEHASAIWRANPAIGLEDVTAAEHQYHYEYERLYEQALRLRILLALRVGTMQRLRESILMLENRVSDSHSPDGDDWSLLIRAYHSTGNPSKVKETYARAKRYYDLQLSQAVPRGIADYFDRSQRNDQDFNLLRPVERIISRRRSEDIQSLATPGERRANPDPRYADLMKIVDLIGVITHSELRLSGSRMEPTQLMRRVRQRLWFSGVLASKWVVDPEVRAELTDFLTVLDHAPAGDVRFMIMNPDGPGYRRLRELRGDEISVEHLPELARLTIEHSSFQVKVFDHVPMFRIHVLDKDVVTFSFYRLDEESYLQGDQSLPSPHIVLDPLAPWPLADAFAMLFHEMWQSSQFLDAEKYA